jgi:hypothetical protein
VIPPFALWLRINSDGQSELSSNCLESVKAVIRLDENGLGVKLIGAQRIDHQPLSMVRAQKLRGAFTAIFSPLTYAVNSKQRRLPDKR